MDAVVICKICDDEQSFRVGWKCFEFKTSPYNICFDCQKVIKEGVLHKE